MTSIYQLAMGSWDCGLDAVSWALAKDGAMELTAQVVELAVAAGLGLSAASDAARQLAREGCSAAACSQVGGRKGERPQLQTQH